VDVCEKALLSLVICLVYLCSLNQKLELRRNRKLERMIILKYRLEKVVMPKIYSTSTTFSLKKNQSVEKHETVRVFW